MVPGAQNDPLTKNHCKNVINVRSCLIPQREIRKNYFYMRINPSVSISSSIMGAVDGGRGEIDRIECLGKGMAGLEYSLVFYCIFCRFPLLLYSILLEGGFACCLFAPE